MNLVLDNNTALITFRKAAIFSSFTDDELNAVANHTFHFSLRREEYIFKYGDMPYYLYIVSSGVLKSVKYSQSGKAIGLSFYGPGDAVGEAAFFTGKPYLSSCHAVVESELFCIPRSYLFMVMPEHMQMAINSIAIIVKRMTLLQERLAAAAGDSAKKRLARLLLELIDKFGTHLPLTKNDIAEMAGLTTETVIRITSFLKSNGILSSSRGSLTVIDIDALRALNED